VDGRRSVTNVKRYKPNIDWTWTLIVYMAGISSGFLIHNWQDSKVVHEIHTAIGERADG